MGIVLHQVIKANAAAIADRFVAAVREHDVPPRPMAREEVIDYLNRYLAEMVVALREDQVDLGKHGAAREHGLQRWYAGYDLKSVVLEYGILQSVILEVVKEQSFAPSIAEVEALARFLNLGIAEAAAEFARKSANETERYQKRLRFLVDAGAALASSLEYEGTLRNVAQAAVPAIADWCAVYVREGNLARRVATAHADPSVLERVMEFRSRWPITVDDPHGPGRVLKTGRSELIEDVVVALLESASDDADQIAMARQLGFYSYMAAPLMLEGESIGVLALASSTPTRRFDREDLSLTEDLARRAATAIEHARLFRNAQEAIRGREEVLGVVSHDLRNPLSTIVMGTGQLLAMTSAPNPDMSRAPDVLRRVQRGAGRMLRIIDDLLDLSALNARTLSLELQPQELGRVIAEAVEAARPAASESNIQISYATTDLRVCCDPGRVGQVLGNLFTNAIRHTPAGGHIDVMATQEGERALVAVRDTGSGIPKEVLPHLFDRFWQGKRQHGGLGLGLTISKGIVETHGGRIWAESTPGVGSTFFFTLPLADAVVSTPAGEVGCGGGAAAPAATGGP